MWTAIGLGAAALGGAALSADAAKDAGQGQTAAAREAIQTSQAADAAARRDLQPYRTVGTSAVSRIGQLLGLPGYATVDQNDPRYIEILNRIIGAQDASHRAQYGMSIFDARSGLSAGDARARFDDENRQAATSEYLKQAGGSAGQGTSVADIMAMDPGYQFRLEEGLKAGRNIAGASGMLNSGATAKALTRYGQDYASGEFNNIFNRLANTAGMGQGAVNAGVNSGANTAGNVGNYLTGAANARGASAIGVANAYGGALNTVGSYYGQQNALDKILANRNGGGYNAGWYNANAPS